jgi:hypothetical protein
MPDPTPPLPFSADAIVDMVREPMLVLSADLRVRRANRSFYRTFKVTPEETLGRLATCGCERKGSRMQPPDKGRWSLSGLQTTGLCRRRP